MDLPTLKPNRRKGPLGHTAKGAFSIAAHLLIDHPAARAAQYQKSCWSATTINTGCGSGSSAAELALPAVKTVPR